MNTFANIRRSAIALLALAGVAMFATSCSDDEETAPAKVSAVKKGTFVDPRDGHEYGWARFGDTDWMTENAQYDLGTTEFCRTYLNYHDDNEAQNLVKYGRLYTYQGALNACPEGWRLPTDEDWQKLEQYMGMSKSQTNKWDWRGNVAKSMFSVFEDECDLNLQLAGYYTDHTVMGTSGFRFMSIYGFYWTSTLDPVKDGEYYIYRKFAYNHLSVYRQSMEKIYQYLSVRYCRDAQD